MAPKKNVSAASNKKKASTTLPDYTGPETRHRTQVLALMAQENPNIGDQHHNSDSSLDSLAAWRSRSPTPTPSNNRLGGNSSTPFQEQSLIHSKGFGIKDSKEPSTSVHRGVSPDTKVMVMTTNATTSDERVAALESKLALLEKALQAKEQEIANLKGKSQVPSDPEPSEELPYPPSFPPQTIPVNASTADQPHREAARALPTASVASLSVQQLQDMIVNTVRLHQGEPQRASYSYSKPYSQRIEFLEMPSGYQPPKFHQFDGRGDPRQHIAHFVETCDSAGTHGDLLVKQFVRSLKDRQ